MHIYLLYSYYFVLCPYEIAVINGAEGINAASVKMPVNYDPDFHFIMNIGTESTDRI